MLCEREKQMNKENDIDHAQIFKRYSETTLPTLWGDFQTIVYRNEIGEEHVAVTLGLSGGERDSQSASPHPASPHESEAPLVRIHSACFTSEVLGSLKCDCREQLHYALEQIQKEGRGAVLYLFQEGRGIGLGAKIKVYALQERGFDTVDANTHLGYEEDARSYQCAVEVLADLGVSSARLLTNNPQKIEALSAAGLKVERAPIEVEAHPLSRGYLETKRSRMGHLLSNFTRKE